MNVKLTLGEKLKDLRNEKGLSLVETEEALNHKISSSTIGKYEKIDSDEADISMSNLILLANYYNVSTDYLLGMTEQRERTNTEVEDLHISDEMISVLKNDNINNRLVSELISHPDFIKFIIDSEIYIDQIASSNISYGNIMIDYVRSQLIKEKGYRLDLPMRTLELSHIDEGELILKYVHEDLDSILSDLRKAHAKDKSTSDTKQNTEKIMNAINSVSEIVKNEGPHSYDEALKILCFVYQINPASLLPEEKNALMSVIKKSPVLRKEINMRGKNKRNNK